MFREFGRLLYGSTSKEFPSAHGLAESVERLRAATKRSVFSNMGETVAVGKVSEGVVRLQRAIPMVGNSFKPFFIGRFEVRGETTVLVGKFTLLPAVKVFMTFWFAFCALVGVGIMVAAPAAHGPTSMLILLQPFLMIGAGVALVALGKWFARNDSTWLSAVIAAALEAPRAGAPAAEEMRMSVAADKVPMALKCAAIFFAASGAAALVAGVAGSSNGPTWGNGSLSVEAAQWGRWNFVYAILMIAFAQGVWRRRPWAWRCGFAVLGLAACWQLAAMSMQPAGSGLPTGMLVFFAVASCVVVAFWGLWWYAQRKHFVWS